MRRPLRLLIAEQEPTRLGVRMALSSEVEICAEADTAGEAIRAARREEPDACLVGRDLAGDGLVATRGIRRVAPRAAVIVLAERGDAEDMLEVVRAGALGYVPGGLTPRRLRKVIDAISKREAVIPRSMVIELVRDLRGGDGGREPLTLREMQVLRLLRRGETTATIGERLGIAPVTVRRHVSDLVRKFGVADRAGLGAPFRAGRMRSHTRPPRTA